MNIHVDAGCEPGNVMQHKRRQILDILKGQGSATIQQLSEELKVTGVTVRHHLDTLREKGVVSAPQVLHRDSPGRPQFEYRLTPKANEYFPKDFLGLSIHMLQEMKAQTDSGKVHAILSGVARRAIADAPKRRADGSFEEHVDSVVDYLTSKGYLASWERHSEGIILHTNNCPYEGLAEKNPEMCQMDEDMLTSLLGVTARCVGHIAKGNNACSYVIAAAKIALSSQ